MSDELVILKIFNNEVDARMALEALKDVRLSAYVFKDDGGCMELHLREQ